MRNKNKFQYLFLLTVFFCAQTLSDPLVNEFLILDLEQLAEYEVVTPTKSNTPLSDAPGVISVITYDEIRRSSARTIPELLRLVPGVHVRWNPMVQTIDVRSFGSNPFTSKVLILIDGVPYNSWNKGGFPQHPGFDFFNIDNVKHLEIVRGPGSALYGENALNGVINIVTLSGKEFRQTTVSLYAGDRNTRSLSLTHGSKIGEEGSIFFSLRNQKTQLPTELWTDINDADAKGTDLFIKGIYKGLQATYYRRQDSYDGFNEPLDAVAPGAAFKSAAEIKQTINIAGLEFNHKAQSQAWSIKANASYADRDGSHCASCHAAGQNERFKKPEDHGYQWQTNTELGIHNIKNMDILIGAEIRKLAAGGHGHELEGSIHISDLGHNQSDHENVESYRKKALYVQNQMTFWDKKLLVIAGLRYDLKTSPTLFDSELFPRVAAVAKPTDKLTLRAGWNKAARYPSFTELYQNSWFIAAETDYAPPIVLAEFNANHELQPEYIESFELGLAYAFTANFQGRVDLFQNNVDDPIIIAYGPQLGFENHPNEARIRGVELELKATPLPSLSTFFNWSYQQNKQKGNGVDSTGRAIEFTYSPKHKVNMGLTYSPRPSLSATLDVSWHDEYSAPSFWYTLAGNLVTPLDDYTYVNLSFQYRLPYVISGSKRPLTLKIDGRNLGNERPIETLAGTPSRVTGREFFIGLEYDWTF